MITDKKTLKKTKLLDEGVRLFMMRGYHGTGIKEILDNVKVPKGSFYAYFDSKEDFLANAISHYIQPFINQLQENINTPELNSYEALKKYFSSLIDDLEKSDFEGGCLLGDMTSELTIDSEIGRKSLMNAVNEYCALIAQALSSGQEQGIIRDDVLPEKIANIIFSAWQGALLRMRLEQSVEPLYEFYETILEDYILAK